MVLADYCRFDCCHYVCYSSYGGSVSIVKPLWASRLRALDRLIETAEATGDDDLLISIDWARRLTAEYHQALVLVEQLEACLQAFAPRKYLEDNQSSGGVFVETMQLLYPDPSLGNEDDPLALRNQYRETHD